MKNNTKTAILRRSKQRDVILELLKGTKSHPTADWIYQEVRKVLPRISLGTVYRNLRLLSERGEILELHYGDGQSRFDGTPENHYHFNCQCCGCVYDVEEPLRKDMEKDLSKKLGFIVNHHRVEFYGICRDCQKKGLFVNLYDRGKDEKRNMPGLRGKGNAWFQGRCCLAGDRAE